MSTNPTSMEIQEQLIWMAKGIAYLSTNSTFRFGVESEILNSPIFEASNANSEQNCIMNYSYYFSDSLSSKLNFKIPGHNYDPLYFAGYTVGTTYDAYFVIRSPEYDVTDTSKKHVIIPENVLLGDSLNNFKAYFLTSGFLDSLEINIEDIEDYYVWVVGVKLNSKIFKKTNHCNNDEKCQPWLGETIANCEDCQNMAAPVTDKMGKLFLQSITSKKDDKNFTHYPFEDYEESYIKNKYEIAFHYATVSGTSIESETISSAGSGTNDHSIPIQNEFSAWGNNCDIKRRIQKNNGNIKINRGIENKLKTIHELLDEDFNMDSDSIYFSFFEHDPTFGGIQHFTIPWITKDAPFRTFRNPMTNNLDLTGITHLVRNTALNNHVICALPPFASASYRNGWSVVGTIGTRDIIECTVDLPEYTLVFRIEPSR